MYCTVLYGRKKKNMDTLALSFEEGVFVYLLLVLACWGKGRGGGLLV